LSSGVPLAAADLSISAEEGPPPGGQNIHSVVVPMGQAKARESASKARKLAQALGLKAKPR